MQEEAEKLTFTSAKCFGNDGKMTSSAELLATRSNSEPRR